MTTNPSPIELTPFCAGEDDPRWFLQNPVYSLRDRYLYASDSAIVVRRPWAWGEARRTNSRVMKAYDREFSRVFKTVAEPVSFAGMELPEDYLHYCACEYPAQCNTCELASTGDGQRPVRAQTILVGGSIFAVRYIRLIQKLPEHRFFVTGPRTAALFTFAGGRGLLFPMAARPDWSMEGGVLTRKGKVGAEA